MKKIYVVIGPTSVGKTKLSITLAKKLNAEIINGDSVCIYKHLNIGSAKPTKDEMSNIKHHLIDIREVDEKYSVYQYQSDVRRLINEIPSQNIVIVGGTGLYIKAALFDYKFSEIKEYKKYDNLSNVELFNKIKEYKKDTTVHINNRQRLITLLNKLENNCNIDNQKDKLLYNAYFIGLTTNREDLYSKINNRVDIMIKNKLLDEVLSLKDKYNNSQILKTAIGYKEFIPYFNNEETLDEVISNIKLNSRRYAKRQYTFFNNQFKEINWYELTPQNFDNQLVKIYNDLNIN